MYVIIKMYAARRKAATPGRGLARVLFVLARAEEIGHHKAERYRA